MPDDTYEGWPNRETWAVVLRIDNDQGWVEEVLFEVRELLAGLAPDEHWKAADLVKENVEEYLFCDDADRTLQRDILHDIGSLWRIDWEKVGEHYVTTVLEAEPENLCGLCGKQTAIPPNTACSSCA